MEITPDIVSKVLDNNESFEDMLEQEMVENTLLAQQTKQEWNNHLQKEKIEKHIVHNAEMVLILPSYKYSLYTNEVEKLKRLRDNSTSIGINYEHKGKYGVRIDNSCYVDKMADNVGSIVDQEKLVDTLWSEYLKALYETLMLLISCKDLTSKQSQMLYEMFIIHPPDRLRRKEDIAKRIGVGNPWGLSHRALLVFGKWYEKRG